VITDKLTVVLKLYLGLWISVDSVYCGRRVECACVCNGSDMSGTLNFCRGVLEKCLCCWYRTLFFLLIKRGRVLSWTLASNANVKNVWRCISTSWRVFLSSLGTAWGHAVAQLVEALRFKPVGRGFDYRWCHWNFLHNPSGRTMALGSTQPLTEMNTRNISWGWRRTVRRADLTIFMCRLSWNLGVWTSWNFLGLSKPVMGLLNLYGQLTFTSSNLLPPLNLFALGFPSP